MGLFSLGACDPLKPCDNGVTEDFEFLEETDKQKQILYYTQNLDFEKVNINILCLICSFHWISQILNTND